MLSLNENVITCYCSMFDNKKIDHILVPSLKMAIITSNEYHNFCENDLNNNIECNDFIKYIDNNLEQQIAFNQEEIRIIGIREENKMVIVVKRC